MIRPVPSLLAGLAALALAVGVPAAAQQFEHSARPPGETLSGYLAPGDVQWSQILPPPPAPGSLEDDQDIAVVKAAQAAVTPERWALAVADSTWVYPEFEAAFGGPIDREHTPALVHLLNEAELDAARVSGQAKRAYARLRPYQRMQVARSCGDLTPPTPEPDAPANQRTSYPSGHTTYGWTAALILAQVAPERAQAVLDRGRDYAFSRVICAHHWPSDTVAGRQIAASVVQRLATVPAFQRDLAAARAEHQQARR